MTRLAGLSGRARGAQAARGLGERIDKEEGVREQTDAALQVICLAAGGGRRTTAITWWWPMAEGWPAARQDSLAQQSEDLEQLVEMVAAMEARRALRCAESGTQF